MKRGVPLALALPLATALAIRAFACGGTQSDASADAGTDTGNGQRPFGEAGVDGGVTDADELYDAAFLSDPSLWTHVTDIGACPVDEARVVPDPFPRRSWTACGTGCLVATAALPIDLPNAAEDVSTPVGIYTSGETYLQLGLETKTGVTIQQVLRLSDGATVAAMKSVAVTGCFGPSPGHGDTPFLFVTAAEIDASGIVSTLFGRVMPGQSTVWQKHPVNAAQQITTFESADALGYGLYAGDLGLLTSPDDTAFTFVGTSPGDLFAASGRGDVVVWSKATASGGTLTAWSASAGEQPLYTAAGAVIAGVRVTDDRIVWTERSGPRAGDGAFVEGALHWSPRATSATGFAVTAGPAVGAGSGLRDLAAGGDFASSLVCAASGAPPCSVIVVQMSTSRMWTIHPRPGNAYRQVLAASPTEIVVSEIGDPRQGQESLTRILRFATTSLDALAATW